MKNTVTIVPVNSGRLKKEFLHLPWKLYRHDPNWVPPLLMQLKRQLNKKENPFFSNGELQLFLAFRGMQCVGRIAAIINTRHNLHYSERSGFFGFYECEKDQETSDMLFNMAEGWLRDRGIKKVLGPINLATHSECGLLVEGQNTAPFLQMPYNLNYYPGQLLKSGYSPETDLLAYEVSVGKVIDNNSAMDKLNRICLQLEERNGIRFRNFNIKKYDIEIDYIRELFNDYMQDNWGFVPVTKAEFRFLADEMKPLLVPELALFAEYNGQPVGFAIALPNVNQVLSKINGRLFPVGIFKYFYYKRSINQVRVALLGISKAFRRKGLEAWFYRQLIIESRKRKIELAELSWISEYNQPMLLAVNHIGASLCRRYRIYKRNI